METLNRIKVLLGMDVENAATPQELKEATEQLKFEDATLEDGTVISADAFEAGNAVWVVVEEDKQPLPVGEYALADGSLLVVTDEGIIAEIKAAEDEATEEVEEVEELQSEDNSKDALIQAIGVLENLVQEFESIKVEVKELNSSFETIQGKAEEDAHKVAEFEAVATSEIKPNPEGNFKAVTEVQNIDVRKLSASERVQYFINKKR
tara:strand:- start:37 stop:657 length:621 start_codon:yes stop_codon:yes gene_type:complete